jgi:DNA-binding Lrp family transcriptional regulator
MAADALDMRLLRAMGVLPFQKGARHPDTLRPAHLADVVGTTRQTVEAHVRRMERDGILLGHELYPNLRHLGLESAVLHVRARDLEHARRCYDAVEPGNGVAGVYAFLTPDVCVDVHWSGPAEKEDRLRLLARLAGVEGPFTLFAREMPPVNTPLSALDWRIVQALRKDALRSPEDVGRELGVSGRTVKRRLERMVRENAVDVRPRVALEKTRHPVPVALLVFLRKEAGRATVAALLQAFDARCLSSWVPPSAPLGDVVMTVYAESTAEVESLRQRAASVPGVARVETLLYAGAREDPGWLDAAIARRAA